MVGGMVGALSAAVTLAGWLASWTGLLPLQRISYPMKSLSYQGFKAAQMLSRLFPERSEGGKGGRCSLRCSRNPPHHATLGAFPHQWSV